MAIGWLGFIRTIQQVVRYLATIAAGLDQQRCSATLIATAAFGFLAMTGGRSASYAPAARAITTAPPVTAQ